MISEFETYHGVVIRDIVVKMDRPVRIGVHDDVGRINSFSVDDQLLLHIKHSSKRLPPWQFTFLPENLAELERLVDSGLPVWLALVCGHDGYVAITYDELRTMNPHEADTTCFVRVDRDRNTMYRVNGTQAELIQRKPRGIAYMLATLDAKLASKG